MWDLWWSGNLAEHHAPYRKLRGFDLNNRNDQSNLSKVSKIMRAITINYNNVATIGEMSIQDRDSTFERLFMGLFRRLFPTQPEAEFDAKRLGDQSYLTLYNHLHNYLD